MREDKSRLMYYAMYGGVFLGLFWMLKYLFVVVADRIPALSIFGSFLAVGTPLILFYFLVKYKTAIVNNNMGYWHGVQFGIMLFFFASIPEAVTVFVNITWFDTAYIGIFYDELIDTVKQLDMGDSLVKLLEEQPLPSTANFVFGNVIMADVFRGVILSLLVVPFALRFTRKSSIINRNS